MPEQAPHSPSPDADTQAWNPEAVGTALGATPEPIRDGYRFDIGPDQSLSLELYPAAGVAMLTSFHTRILLSGQDPPQIRGDVVAFSAGDDEDLRLFVTADGVVSLQRKSHAVSDAPRATQSRDKGATHVDHHMQGSEPVEVSESPQSQSEEPAERVDLVGRIVTQPRYKHTKRKRLVGEFPLEIETDDGETITMAIVVFSEQASKLRDGLVGASDDVRVIGYHHEREVPVDDGTTRIVGEIYAARVFLRE